jgi:hypothetical protein
MLSRGSPRLLEPLTRMLDIEVKPNVTVPDEH